MGLVKTRRLAAMQKARLRGGYCAASIEKTGLKSRQLKVTPPPRSLHPLPPHFAKSGGNPERHHLISPHNT